MQPIFFKLDYLLNYSVVFPRFPLKCWIYVSQVASLKKALGWYLCLILHGAYSAVVKVCINGHITSPPPPPPPPQFLQHLTLSIWTSSNINLGLIDLFCQSKCKIYVQDILYDIAETLTLLSVMLLSVHWVPNFNWNILDLVNNEFWFVYDIISFKPFLLMANLQIIIVFLQLYNIVIVLWL